MKKINLISFNCCNFGDWTSELRYERIKSLILTQLQDADCFALQEIGAHSEHETSNEKSIAHTMHKLCAEMNALQTSKIYTYIDIPPTPNSTGGQEDFNIRCGFITTQVLEIIKIESIAWKMPAFTGCINLQYAPSRYPLALFAKFQEQPICIINCHLKSMRAQPKKLSHIFKKQRHEQASLIYDFINSLQKLNPQLAIILMGDCNDLPNSKTIELLKGDILHSIYPPKLKNISTTLHRNAPVILDYMFYNNRVNLEEWEIKSLNRSLAISDHNPVCATFTFV